MKYKESLVSVQTQTHEVKKPKDHLPKDIEQKNRTIEMLTNRTNLYQKRIEQNRQTIDKLEQEVQKHKAIVNDFAKKHQEMEDTIRQKGTYHKIEIREL